MSKVRILTLFKKNFTELIDELIDKLDGNGDLIAFRVLIVNQIPVTTLMDKFVDFVVPYKDQITDRDESYFINDTNVFSMVGDASKVNYFKDVWQSGKLTDDDKDTIFKYFDVFIKLAETYSLL
jgi:hypothetical protein